MVHYSVHAGTCDSAVALLSAIFANTRDVCKYFGKWPRFLVFFDNHRRHISARAIMILRFQVFLGTLLSLNLRILVFCDSYGRYIPRTTLITVSWGHFSAKFPQYLLTSATLPAIFTVFTCNIFRQISMISRQVPGGGGQITIELFHFS